MKNKIYIVVFILTVIASSAISGIVGYNLKDDNGSYKGAMSDMVQISKQCKECNCSDPIDEIVNQLKNADETRQKISEALNNG